MTLWLILAALAAAALFPFVIETMRPRMNAARRSVAPGKFAELSQGLTHYRWLGAETGPVAVCVHGLTTPSYVWEPLAEGLGEMGYRVLIYDLYGRGFSDRPSGEQSGDFFANQLDELLADQEIEQDITLLGYSMGGAVVTAFAARATERLRHLVLIAPAGLDHDLGPIADLAVKYNWFGRWMTLGFYPKSLRRATEAERDLKTPIKNMVDMQIAETRLKGFAPAVLSSLRGIIDEDLEGAHRTIAEAKTPVLAIWGEADEIIPLSCQDKLSELNPCADHSVVKDTGHTLTYTETKSVLGALQKHLKP